MRSRLLLTCSILLTACDGGDTPPDAGMDASSSTMDAGRDAGSDAGTVWTGPGCDTVSGIECDGDWADRCSPVCAATECCSPQSGRFECVARGADGSCPAANIWVDESRIEDQTMVYWRFFPEDDCALVEGCVEGPGWRRLLGFGTWTPNTGTADLYLGVPDPENPQFMYSSCHDHYHFNGYAEYELRDTTSGDIVAEGHKQAFCLLDYFQYPGTDDSGARYDCENQGIQRDWQDVYDETLDCQWIDITNVTPGDYTLRIDLNVERTLLESSYDDNRGEVVITIPEDTVDIDAPCPFPHYGGYRDCGFTQQATQYTCTGGTTVSVGCSGCAGVGTCVGDTVLRVCPASAGTDCTAQDAIALNDDSGCEAGGTYDYCSASTFNCPGDATTTTTFTIFTGAWDTEDADSQCNVAVNGALPVTTTP